MIDDRQLKFSFQLKKLDLAEKHVLKDQYTPTRIPTLEEYIDECLALDMKMIIDLKTIGTAEKTAEMIIDFFKRKPRMYENALASSFYPDLLYMIRLKDPKICCSMAWRPGYIAYKCYTPVSKELVRRFTSPFQVGRGFCSHHFLSCLEPTN